MKNIRLAGAVIGLYIGLIAVIILLLVVWLKADSATSDVRSEASALKHSVQSPSHGKDIALWCNGINAVINYERGYQHATLAQSESEAKAITQAIEKPNAHGLTTAQATFIRLYLSSVVALEREAPQTLSLHPFALGDLKCKQIEGATAQATNVR